VVTEHETKTEAGGLVTSWDGDDGTVGIQVEADSRACSGWSRTFMTPVECERAICGIVKSLAAAAPEHVSGGDHPVHVNTYESEPGVVSVYAAREYGDASVEMSPQQAISAALEIIAAALEQERVLAAQKAGS
jgi:hypothetical protein